MVCLLTRADYRRWERWFNGVAGKPMPEHYEIRDYVSPYAHDPKQLWPDPPKRKAKPEKEPPKKPKDMTEEELAAREVEIRLTIDERAARRKAKDVERQAKRRVRVKASESAARLNAMWDAARAAALDQGDGEGEK